MNVNETPRKPSEFRPFGFEIEKTKDESPTLRILNGTDFGEWMHHSGGAFSETRLIYGQALSWGFENVPGSEPIEILSLGLGLGYVEILAYAFSLLHNRSIKMISFEKVEGLRILFKDFFSKQENFWANVEESHQASQKATTTYSEILMRTALNMEVDPEKLFLEIQKAIEEKTLMLEGDFVLASENVQTFNILSYDAFSKKTSPELWDEEWMKRVFAKGARPSCISSYASNGSFKRALLASGYSVEVLEGFQGKRNRTWATQI